MPRGAVVMMDNTWATPLYFRPLDHGVDISIHAATKYPAGHSDVLLGTVSANEACWPKLHRGLHHARLLRRTRRRLPGAAGPAHDGRAARTAPEKRARASRAGWKTQQGVARVLHPGAREPSRPRALEARLLRRERHLLDRAGRRRHRRRRTPSSTRCSIFGLGYSWGGYESLAVPVCLGDRTVAKGPYEGPVIRLQIGLEDVEDLKADLSAALEAARRA